MALSVILKYHPKSKIKTEEFRKNGGDYISKRRVKKIGAGLSKLYDEDGMRLLVKRGE